MAIYYCRHQRLQLDSFSYYCIDCQARFEIVALGQMPKPPEPPKAVVAQEIVPGPKPAEPVVDSSGYGKWKLGAVAALLGAAWLLGNRGCSKETSVIKETIQSAPCEPKVVEVPGPEKIVYKDKECPEVKQAVCNPEVVYVPQAKPDCTKEIAAGCRECRQSLDFFLKRQKEPSYKLDESTDEENFDEEF